jgi:divalent metal cation (Fe/Co/Zn/Cd) transporter
MSPTQLPVAGPGPGSGAPARLRDASWLHDARRASTLSWASLIWMTIEGVLRLIDGSHTSGSVLGIAVTASAIVLMPALGRAKLRLGERLGSRATAGEGVQNLMCGVQATAALVALIGLGGSTPLREGR